MFKNIRLFVLLFAASSLLIIQSNILTAQDGSEEFDFKLNTVSNIEFPLTANGIFGLDVKQGKGACYWPRGSENQYIFGGGLWFGAKKTVGGEEKTITELTYNPNTGKSWMIPGRRANGDKYIPDPDRKYRIYSSVEFDKITGESYDPKLADWPIWTAENSKNKYGIYVDNVDKRNLSDQPEEPVFRSDEDMFCTYKDSDLSFYEGGETFRREEGCPLGLQYEQTLYSWGTGEFKDDIIIIYNVTNTSDDLLRDCWFAPVMDVDLALKSNPAHGASNDRTRFYYEDDSKNMIICWTDTDYGEENFGYLGFSLIMTPAVDLQGNLLPEEEQYDPEKQLGMRTFKDWSIAQDFATSAERYAAISKDARDAEGERGDKRVIVATGPFNLHPGQSCKVAMLINFADRGEGGISEKGRDKTQSSEVTATTEELEILVNNATRATEKFYSEIAGTVGVDLVKYSGSSMIANTFPNPATDYISVKFNLKTPAVPRFEIINTLGETVVMINNESFAAGSNIINIDTKSLASGSYYLKISVGAYQEVRMISVVR